MSSSPCVGCAWRPSPALTTCTCGAQCCAIRYGAPLSPWRTTNMSACIAERLAIVSSRLSPLAVERARDVEVDDVGRQPLGRDLEGGAGARAVLEEQVEHALAAQQRHLLDVAVVDAEEGARGVEDLRQHRPRQALDRQQVDQLAVRVELRVAARQHQVTSSTAKLKAPAGVARQRQALAGRQHDARGGEGGGRSAARARRGRPAPPA